MGLVEFWISFFGLLLSGISLFFAFKGSDLAKVFVVLLLTSLCALLIWWKVHQAKEINDAQDRIALFIGGPDRNVGPAFSKTRYEIIEHLELLGQDNCDVARAIVKMIDKGELIYETMETVDQQSYSNRYIVEYYYLAP